MANDTRVLEGRSSTIAAKERAAEAEGEMGEKRRYTTLRLLQRGKGGGVIKRSERRQALKLQKKEGAEKSLVGILQYSLKVVSTREKKTDRS